MRNPYKNRLMIGVDLGTTNCCTAVLEGGEARVVPMRDGQRTMPSVVAFTDDGMLVGGEALRQGAVNPTRTVHGVKRLMGRKYDDPRVQLWSGAVPYPIVPAENGDARVRIDDKLYSPEEISSFMLRRIKEDAEAALGRKVSGAAVTVPAYFDERQRQATKTAGRLAGLPIDSILNEPTAAALAYGASKGRDELLAVFDLGGGTFDITILQKRGNLYEVIATHGDTFLGGEDFDSQLVSSLLNAFRKQHGVDLATDPVALHRLRDAAVTAKHDLSTSDTTSIKLPFIGKKGDEALHLTVDRVTRLQLERLCSEVAARVREPCQQALAEAGIEPDQVDRVLLAGGMTRMPLIQQKVEQIFGRTAEHAMNPDEIVGIGAAAQCGILTGDLASVTLLDVTPHSLGVKVGGDEMRVLIAKNSSVPTSAEGSFTTTYDMQEAVKIAVYQGESDRVSENTLLGIFRLADLPQGPMGSIEIKVTFVIDADGTLQVTALETESGNNIEVEISPASGLTVREAQSLADENDEQSETDA
jgi:molecular chaperone DnaK